MPLLIAVLLCLLVPATASAAACPGADPCPYTSSGIVGQRAEGVLRFPQATAVGPDGSVYVADQFTHAIQVFGPDGQFRREIGAAGSGPGGLSSVGAVAVGPDGSIYVADGNDRIDRFAADGTLLHSWGSNGSGVGEFRFGAGGGNDSGAGGGIAIGAGFVFVADTRNDRVQRFNLDGTGASVIVPPGRVKRPQGLAVSGGRLIVADDLGHRLAIFDLGGAFIGTVGSGPGPRPGQLRNPYDVAVDPAGRVFVADNSNHRVVRYGPAPAYTYRGRWGAFGSGRGQLQYPRGLAADAQGRTFVASPGGNRIDMFDVGGAALGSFGRSGRVAGQFIRPHGVGADASGVRAIADSVNGRIQLLRPDGSVAAMFGAPAPGPTLLPDPVAVAFDAEGLVYVLDQRRSRVLVFDRAGKIIRTIGSRGRGPGRLLSPSALAVAGNVVYVADTGNGRIVRFTRAGSHLGSIGRFNSIRGIAVTPDGSVVYGVDAALGPDHGHDRHRRRPGGDRPRGAELAGPDRSGRGRQRVGGRPRQRPRARLPAGRLAAHVLRRARRGRRAVRRADRDRRRLQRLGDRRRCRQQPRPAVPDRADRVRIAAADRQSAGPDPGHPAGPVAARGVRGADAHERHPRHPAVPGAGPLRPAVPCFGRGDFAAAVGALAAGGDDPGGFVVAGGSHGHDPAAAVGRGCAAAGTGVAGAPWAWSPTSG